MKSSIPSKLLADTFDRCLHLLENRLIAKRLKHLAQDVVQHGCCFRGVGITACLYGARMPP